MVKPSSVVSTFGLPTLAALAVYLWSGRGLEVVRSALGKQAKAPDNADVIEKGLATMQANWYWFLLAVIPLALAVLMGAVGLGVNRSSEWLFKLVLALVGVIAFAPTFVA